MDFKGTVNTIAAILHTNRSILQPNPELPNHPRALQ